MSDVTNHMSDVTNHMSDVSGAMHQLLQPISLEPQCCSLQLEPWLQMTSYLNNVLYRLTWTLAVSHFVYFHTHTAFQCTDDTFHMVEMVLFGFECIHSCISYYLLVKTKIYAHHNNSFHWNVNFMMRFAGGASPQRPEWMTFSWGSLQ